MNRREGSVPISTNERELQSSMSREEQRASFETTFIPTKDGTQLSADIGTSTASPSRGAIIFVHGFGGNKQENGLFSTLAEHATTKGFHTVQYDWRGIGQSQGEFHSSTLLKHISDFEEVVDWTRSSFPENSDPLSAVGFSLGAAVVGSALCNDTALDSAAYLSPAARPRLSMWPRYDTEDIRREIEERGYMEKPGSSVVLGQPILDSLRDTDLGPQAFDVNVPLFVCHGTADSRIDISHTRELVAGKNQASDFQYIELDGASHSFRPADIHWQEVASAVTRWFS